MSVGACGTLAIDDGSAHCEVVAVVLRRDGGKEEDQVVAESVGRQKIMSRAFLPAGV